MNKFSSFLDMCSDFATFTMGVLAITFAALCVYVTAINPAKDDMIHAGTTSISQSCIRGYLFLEKGDYLVQVMGWDHITGKVVPLVCREEQSE